MKKSLIALAVSSAVVAPASVQAAEVYGFVNTTIENGSTDNGGAVGPNGGLVIFNTNGNPNGADPEESAMGLSDTAATRLGVTGSEDLGNGLTAGYTFEFDITTSFGGSQSVTGGGGSNNEDSAFATRLSNVSIGGDFGTVKMGTQWGVLYEYAGWNVYRTDGHGGATHYYATGGLEDDPYGLRVDNTLAYTYGGGGYSSDPFTLTVQARMDGNGENGVQGANNIDDDETIDSLTVGAQGTVPGNVTINGVVHTQNNTSGNNVSVAEQQLITLGARWSSGPFYVGGTFYSRDLDNAAGNEPTAINVLGGMDFGGGFSGYVGVGSGDADTNSGAGDLSTVFLQAQKEFSSRTKIYAEFETAEIDGTGVDVGGTGLPDGSDGETQVLAVGLKHSF